MGLARIDGVMARASWAGRCWGRGSVLRRSWPKFDSYGLVCSTGHRGLDGVVVLCVAAPCGRRRAQMTSSVPASVHARGLWRCHSRGPGAGSARRRAVPDPRRRRRWGSQGSVAAVRAVGRPAHRDARPVTQQRPLPAAFVAVSGVGARAGAAAGGLRTGRRRRSLNA